MTRHADMLARSRLARSRFLAACVAASADTTSFRSPSRAPDGAPWWIDVAYAGPADAERALVLAGSLAGFGGLTASAVMTGLLGERRHEALAPQIRCVALHAVDPLSSARGGADRTATTEALPQWSDAVLAAADARFNAYAGAERPVTARPPDTTDRGGWIDTAVAAVAAEVAANARHVCLLEFRTGLGPRGTVAAMSCHPAETAANARVATWFGAAAGTQADGPAASDLLHRAFARPFEEGMLTAVAVELGTYAPAAVLALAPDTTGIRAGLEGIFAPEDADWLRQASETVEPIVARASDRLRSL